MLIHEMKLLDFSADICPLPLIKIKLWLKQAQLGNEVTVLLKDTGSRQDIPAFLSALGQEVTELENSVILLRIQVRKLTHGLSIQQPNTQP
ncbi:MAG: tRNA 2-thiouridine synthesizing protein A [Moritella sp.]|jgi:tRNA 2-thiouridine synthesizing protein A